MRFSGIPRTLRAFRVRFYGHDGHSDGQSPLAPAPAIRRDLKRLLRNGLAILWGIQQALEVGFGDEPFVKHVTRSDDDYQEKSGPDKFESDSTSCRMAPISLSVRHHVCGRKQTPFQKEGT